MRRNFIARQHDAATSCRQTNVWRWKDQNTFCTAEQQPLEFRDLVQSRREALSALMPRRLIEGTPDHFERQPTTVCFSRADISHSGEIQRPACQSQLVRRLNRGRSRVLDSASARRALEDRRMLPLSGRVEHSCNTSPMPRPAQASFSKVRGRRLRGN